MIDLVRRGDMFAVSSCLGDAVSRFIGRELTLRFTRRLARLVSKPALTLGCEEGGSDPEAASVEADKPALWLLASTRETDPVTRLQQRNAFLAGLGSSRWPRQHVLRDLLGDKLEGAGRRRGRP